MPNRAPSPLDLALGRLADGDPGAFDLVFEALWSPLLRYCSKALGNPTDGEDAAQRALLQLLENAPSYDRERSALAWALGFAYWQCRTERTRRRRRATEPEVEVGSSINPEDLAAEKEQHQLVAAALAELSEVERSLIVEELPLLIQGVTPVALRKRRQRVLQRVRDACWQLLKPRSIKS